MSSISHIDEGDNCVTEVSGHLRIKKDCPFRRQAKPSSWAIPGQKKPRSGSEPILTGLPTVKEGGRKEETTTHQKLCKQRAKLARANLNSRTLVVCNSLGLDTEIVGGSGGG